MLKTFLQIGSISTMADGSCKVTCYTPELPSNAMTELFELKKDGQVAAIFQGKERESVEVLEEPKEGKTPSSRLRSVFYLIWKQEKPAMTKEAFYELKMEEIIEHYKSKLK